jgi:hypothetical protein
MAKILMKVNGLDGQVALLNDRVVILREGFINSLFFGFSAKREIPLGAVSEIRFRDATRFKYGEIEFVRGGRSTDEKRSAKHSTVKFTRKHHDEFERLKEKMFEMMDQLARQRQA